MELITHNQHTILEVIRLLTILPVALGSAYLMRRIIKNARQSEFALPIYYLMTLSTIALISSIVHILTSHSYVALASWVIPTTWLAGHVLFAIWNYVLFFVPKKLPMILGFVTLLLAMMIPFILVTNGHYHSDGGVIGRSPELLTILINLVLMFFILTKTTCLYSSQKAVLGAVIIQTVSSTVMLASHQVFDGAFVLSHWVALGIFAPYIVWIGSIWRKICK